jgi:hypothetical protein
MESSSAPADVRTRRDPSAIRITQVGLLIGCLGAALIIFHPFGLGVVGIFLALGGAIIAAPGNLGQGWFVTVALGAIVAALSRLIADSNETLGGWLAVIGSLTLIIGAVLGFPSGEEE